MNAVLDPAPDDRPFAIVDIGSNSGRMIVFRLREGEHLDVVEDARAPLRLARELRDSDQLGPEAIDRTIEALRDFVAVARGAGATRMIAVATSAVRDASDGHELMERAHHLGVPLQTIDGDHEAMLGFYGISPLVTAFSTAAGNVVQFLVSNGLLPLTSIFIEPAKVLFLNNAINHGVLTPLGIQQSLEQGKSILVLLEANPGPGFGILLAYMFFGRGAAKASAPGAAIIHFLGGIHEIYFPYVLMRPLLILAAIAGGMTGVATLAITNSGLVAPSAPGSIIAVLAQTARDSYIGVILAVLLATAASFVVASVILNSRSIPLFPLKRILTVRPATRAWRLRKVVAP